MLIIAHRGASGHAPENTMVAFRLALETGAQAVELDVHQTQDNELAVIHDFDLKRVGRPKRRSKIKNMTWDELSKADVGCWFGKKFKEEHPPRLEDVLSLAEGRAEVHIELKAGSRIYPGIERRVLDLLRRRRALDWTPLSSFDHQALFNLRALSPQARLGYLLGATPMTRAYREMAELKVESLNISRRQINARKVQTAHDKGLKVLVYTVNAQQELDGLAAMGVDGVFANFPELKP